MDGGQWTDTFVWGLLHVTIQVFLACSCALAYRFDRDCVAWPVLAVLVAAGWAWHGSHLGKPLVAMIGPALVGFLAALAAARRPSADGEADETSGATKKHD
jgi:hypothetical protein